VLALKKAGFVLEGGHHGQLLCEVAEPRVAWIAFTVVRNHFDALISWMFRRYRGKGGPEPMWDVASLKAQIASNNWIEPNTMWHLHSDDADVVLKYESFKIGMAGLLAVRGLVLPKLEPVNVTENRQGRHYREFFNGEMRSYVEDRFGAELDRFGYSY
jgi:hypothetical protein